MKFLLLYSSRFGHTRKIALALQQQWQKQGIQVDLKDLNCLPALKAGQYDKIIIGASIRYGHYAPQLAQWTQQHQALLNSLPSAFFSVSILARKPHRNTPETHTYTRKFFAANAWQPKEIGIFAGELNYAKYHLVDRYLMKMVMWLNKGETQSDAIIEMTDWQKVEDFGQAVIDMH
ncbi:menaquinone-dependent protoporphyrinogen IX dehydrogenase [Neisseriaceae bacterium ESL0693]|nr:menaquinone-dependent protoporphyrinogen IX dehydrogenase [Neisseriaceae bacterium ESL0693]